MFRPISRDDLFHPSRGLFRSPRGRKDTLEPCLRPREEPKGEEQEDGEDEVQGEVLREGEVVTRRWRCWLFGGGAGECCVEFCAPATGECWFWGGHGGLFE